MKVSTRVFVAVTIAAAGLHYRCITSRLSQVQELAEQERKLRSVSPDAREHTALEEVRVEVAERRRLLSRDGTGSEFLGHLTHCMQELDLRGPMIRAGQARSAHGIVQSTVDVEFRGPLPSILGLLRELSERGRSWGISRLSIERGPGQSADVLSVGLQLVTMAAAAGESAP